jgi:hypothetical protein
MLPAHVAVTKRRDMQIRRHLFHADRSIYPTSRSILDDVSRGSVRRLRAWGARKKGGQTGQATAFGTCVRKALAWKR